MKNTVKINESTLRKIVAESVKKVLSEIINPFDDGFGGVDTAMAASYSNKNIGNAWLKKAGMRRDMLQGGKPVPNNKEENESKINESCSYKINESTLSQIITKSVKKVLKEEYDWYHYNDGPSTEEETFADELRYVIEEYGLPAARYIGIKDFVSWCVDIINDVVNENKKIFEPEDEPEVPMRGEY